MDFLQYDSIVCLGAFGGRFDHMMANINTLYTAHELQKKPVYLLSSTQVVSLLQPVPGFLNHYVCVFSHC